MNNGGTQLIETMFIWTLFIGGAILFFGALIYSVQNLGLMAEVRNTPGIFFWILVSLFIATKCVSHLQDLPDYLNQVRRNE